jgi:predicted transcriptional regulator
LWILEKKEIHLVKKVSKELGLTYKELGEEIGYSESTLRKSVSENRITLQLEKAIELYLKTLEFEKDRKEMEKIKDNIRTLFEFSRK